MFSKSILLKGEGQVHGEESKWIQVGLEYSFQAKDDSFRRRCREGRGRGLEAFCPEGSKDNQTESKIEVEMMMHG